MQNKIIGLLLLALFLTGCAGTGKTEKTSVARYYYRTKELLGVSNFRGALRHGLTTTYYKSGKILQEINYSEGEKHGTAREYYETGELKTEEVYENGTLLSRKEYSIAGELLGEETYPAETGENEPAEEAGEEE